MFDKNKTIAIASDHAGYELKEYLKEELKKQGYLLKDFGTNSIQSVDYPDYIHPLSKSIQNSEIELGLIMCGSGNGVAMVANKYSNIRTAMAWNTELAKLARQHNNSNVLSLSARFIAKEYALEIVNSFLNSDFEGGRHQLRIDKINKI